LFFAYFFFFGFFFALGTEITCTSNVAITGLTLPTATQFCPRYQASSKSFSIFPQLGHVSSQLYLSDWTEFY